MDQLIHQVTAQVEKICLRKVAPDDQLLADGLLDSIGFVDLLVALQDSFGVSFDIMTIDREEMATVQRIASFLQPRLPS